MDSAQYTAEKNFGWSWDGSKLNEWLTNWTKRIENKETSIQYRNTLYKEMYAKYNVLNSYEIHVLFKVI